MKKTDSKPAKKSKVVPEYDAGRETRVLLEEINKTLNIIVEQNGSIIKKLEEHDKRFDKLESELRIIIAELNKVRPWHCKV